VPMRFCLCFVFQGKLWAEERVWRILHLLHCLCVIVLASTMTHSITTAIGVVTNDDMHRILQRVTEVTN
jgi:hypothetical protein